MRSNLQTYGLAIQAPAGFLPDPGIDRRQFALRLAGLLQAIAGGEAPGQPGETVAIVTTPTSGVALLKDATGTLTLAAVADGNTAVINGVTFTAVAAAPTEGQFLDSGTDIADATDLVRAINVHTATAALAFKGCNLAGTIALASVLAGDWVEIDGVRFTAFPGATPDRYDRFDMSGSNTADCTDLVRAINAHPTLSRRVLAVDGGAGTLTLRQKNDGTAIPLAASSATFTLSGSALAAVAVVLVTSQIPGSIGNAITTTATGNVTAGAARLSGGGGASARLVYSLT